MLPYVILLIGQKEAAMGAYNREGCSEASRVLPSTGGRADHGSFGSTDRSTM